LRHEYWTTVLRQRFAAAALQSRNLDPEQQKLIDDDHLRLLRIGYFIAGGWNLFWAFFPLIYVAFGATFFFAGFPREASGPDPRTFGIILVAVGSIVSLLMATLAVMKLMTAKALRLRKSRTLCLVTAGLSCLAVPYGTALGVATFVLLSRPSVHAQFA
jgi:hypothetical protein